MKSKYKKRVDTKQKNQKYPLQIKHSYFIFAYLMKLCILNEHRFIVRKIFICLFTKIKYVFFLCFVYKIWCCYHKWYTLMCLWWNVMYVCNSILLSLFICSGLRIETPYQEFTELITFIIKNNNINNISWWEAEQIQRFLWFDYLYFVDIFLCFIQAKYVTYISWHKYWDMTICCAWGFWL